jgi:hypothetical protein
MSIEQTQSGIAGTEGYEIIARIANTLGSLLAKGYTLEWSEAMEDKPLPPILIDGQWCECGTAEGAARQFVLTLKPPQ